MKLNKYTFLLAGGLALMSTSCNDFLDREPLDQITPDTYLLKASDMADYALKQYNFSTHGGGLGIWAGDDHTDNQAVSSYDTRWLPGRWVVLDHYDTDSSDPWYFGNIYNCNYFLERVVPRYEAGELDENCRHYIGEMFFLRAWNYFQKLKAFGDFPIVEKTLPDQKDELVEASKRQPRHKVARFILSDLEKAIGFLTNNPNGGKNRITQNVAYLVKSRVALYEASWEYFHKNTALVPNGPGYPGGQVEYNADEEIDFFLTQCKKAAKMIADQELLAENKQDLVDAEGAEKMNNPYYAQFCDNSLEKYSEILMWRDYENSLEIVHSAGKSLSLGGGSGFTRQFMKTFLMEDGRPYYAASSEKPFKGEESVTNMRANREQRLRMFVMKPGEMMFEGTFGEGGGGNQKLGKLPRLLGTSNGYTSTGYQLRKGLSNQWVQDVNQSSEGCPIFRAAEAYLNYIEASCIEYDKKGSEDIDALAETYWNTLRSRVGLPSYTVTNSATDLTKEDDWAKYSGKTLVSKLMYNIRRERRCELMEEGFRMDDLKRWRALDMLDAEWQGKWQPEGVNLWGNNGYAEQLHENYETYKGDTEKYGDLAEVTMDIKYDGSPESNISAPEDGEFFRLYQKNKTSDNQLLNNGYHWCEAHYLNPISIIHIRNTASNPSDLSTSVIYQNPGWPLVANEGAEH